MLAPVPESLHGDERLLENGLGSDGDLAKDKTGEDSSERLLPRDGEESADFPVGVDGECNPVPLDKAAEDTNLPKALSGDTALPTINEEETDFNPGTSGHTALQLDVEGDVAEN